MPQHQYYIPTQAAIAGVFDPPPVDNDLCQCLVEGGVWRYTNGQWVLSAGVVAIGLPVPTPLLLSQALQIFLVADDPSVLLGYGTWELLATGKLFVSDTVIEVWCWRRLT